MKKIKYPVRFLLLILLTTATAVRSAAPDLSNPAAPKKNKTLIAVGDLNLADGLGDRILKDPAYPWSKVKDILDSADILVGNLEAPLSARGKMLVEKTWLLRADPRTVNALVAAGFDVLTLANNHIMDYGPIALQDTLETLKANKLAYTGAGMNLNEARQPALVTTPDDVTLAFLAYSLTFPEQFWAGPNSPGTPYGNPAVFLNDIKKAKEIADLVVVSFHWSSELLNYAKPYQKTMARQCIDAGASIVLGHHPHVPQGLEVYHGGLIAYSLGNFAFGSLSGKVKDGIILAVDFDKSGPLRARIYPVNINNYEVAFQPEQRHGWDAERVLRDLRSFSGEFGTQIKSEGDYGTVAVR